MLGLLLFAGIHKTTTAHKRLHTFGILTNIFANLAGHSNDMTLSTVPGTNAKNNISTH